MSFVSPASGRGCATSGLMCSEWRWCLDHLVGSRQQRRRDCESERLRSPVVDDQLEPRCLLQRQLTRWSATQDLCHLLSRARINLGCGRAVGHKTAGVYEKTERIYHGQVRLEGELGELLRPRIGAQNDVGIHKQRVRTLRRDNREFWLQLFGGSDLSLLQCDTETRCGLL